MRRGGVRMLLRSAAIVMIVLLLSSCATTWQERGSFYRSAQTTLAADSTPPGARVFLGNRYLGETPLSTILECEQEMRRKARKVSYWDTQPGLALLLSLVSLGLYVPFSLIPVDVETSQEPTGAFKNNEFAIRIEADGYKSWSTSVICGPQPAVSLRAVLEKA
jgi:PEGA domain-containing protein